MPMNPQAEELNAVIKKHSPALFDLLSGQGKGAFFPKKGILAQTAEGKTAEINATIGEAREDDGSTMCLDSLASLVHLDKSDTFPYAPSFGKPQLRKKWKEMIVHKNPGLKGKEFSTPVVTNALTHGLSVSGALFLDSDDILVLPDKFWGNYNLIFAPKNPKKVTFPTFTENGSFNTAGLKEKLLNAESNKKVVLLNFPNNPTGYTPTIAEGEEIVAALVEAAEAGNNIAVLIDDAYFGLSYEANILHHSLFEKLADAHERIVAVKIDGATKEDFVWGFRIGFLTIGTKGGTAELYEAMEAKLSGYIRGNISNASHVGQSLLLSVFDNPAYNEQKEQKFQTLFRRYKIVKEIFETKSEYADFFTPLPFNSGYFMCVEIKNIDTETLRKKLLSDYSTGVIAMGDLVRIAFSSTPTDKLEQLFANLYNACKDLSA